MTHKQKEHYTISASGEAGPLVTGGARDKQQYKVLEVISSQL